MVWGRMRQHEVGKQKKSVHRENVGKQMDE